MGPAHTENEVEPEIDHGTLRRFLRARSLNVEKALKSLREHLKWMQVFKPNGFIDESNMKSELAKKKIWLSYWGAFGYPIGVLLAQKHRTSDRDLDEFICKRYTIHHAFMWSGIQD
ncbi:hypothetical protein KP509_26G004100 [Ceratopteris richardii]|uniref:CRAL/TRIO N-terminal domain-containing protein n=1 Tax=Ceratopteris richardii TaxID=49495 RepID=A0A8T2RJL6_CERRI|nr:hypothetical protein KP509_26G004100 [Ceratopteris richardii]